MATLNIPNVFTNGTPAIATEVNANFNAVKTFTEGISSGANIDDGAVTYAKLNANVSTTIQDASVIAAGDAAQVVLGMQVFG